MEKRSSLITALILLMGGGLRCAHLFMIDFLHEPFRLGGLFALFADEIAARNFRLPVTIPYYSAGGIPFAYPPLGFYVEAVFVKIFPNQVIGIANLLPPLVSLLALGLAGRFFHRWAEGWNLRSWSALTTYALLPNAFFNQIEAAGLAESFGSLAVIIYFELILNHRRQPSLISALYVGLGLALCVVSSPGSALGASVVFIALIIDALFSFRWNQRAQPYLNLLAAGVTAVVLSGLYWLPILLNHGLEIFLSPIGMQYETTGEATYSNPLGYLWFTYSFLQQEGAYFWSLAGALGIGWLVRHRDFFLPLAFVFLFSIPRENAWVTALPAALLIAHGLADVLAPLIQNSVIRGVSLRAVLMRAVFGVIGAGLLAIGFILINAQVRSENWKVAPAFVEVLRRAGEMIPSDAQVIILGNEGLREWAPYLLEREVLNTEFGLEWQPGEYQQIMSANKIFEMARGWQTIAEAARSLTEAEMVYVIAVPVHMPEGFNLSLGELFLIKMHTREIQIGILNLR